MPLAQATRPVSFHLPFHFPGSVPDSRYHDEPNVCIHARGNTDRSMPPIRMIAQALVILCVALTAANSTAAKASEADWTLRKQEQGILVHTRPVPGSQVMAFKGEGLVEIPVASIYKLLRNGDRFKEWFPNTSESKLLKREGNTSYQYSVMETPWPASDRDNIFRSVSTRDPKTGTVHISVDAAPATYPIQKDRHRVTKAAGSWRLEPRDGNSTWVIFSMHLEPGGGLPDWMVNTRVVETPYEALVNLRKILGAGTPAAKQ